MLPNDSSWQFFLLMMHASLVPMRFVVDLLGSLVFERKTVNVHSSVFDCVAVVMSSATVDDVVCDVYSKGMQNNASWQEDLGSLEVQMSYSDWHSVLKQQRSLMWWYDHSLHDRRWICCWMLSLHFSGPMAVAVLLSVMSVLYASLIKSEAFRLHAEMRSRIQNLDEGAVSSYVGSGYCR